MPEKPVKEKAELVTLRLYPSETVLAYKLKSYHRVKSIGRLFSKLMRQNVVEIKRETSKTGSDK